MIKPPCSCVGCMRCSGGILFVGEYPQCWQSSFHLSKMTSHYNNVSFNHWTFEHPSYNSHLVASLSWCAQPKRKRPGLARWLIRLRVRSLARSRQSFVAAETAGHRSLPISSNVCKQRPALSKHSQVRLEMVGALASPLGPRTTRQRDKPEDRDPFVRAGPDVRMDRDPGSFQSKLGSTGRRSGATPQASQLRMVLFEGGKK